MKNTYAYMGNHAEIVCKYWDEEYKIIVRKMDMDRMIKENAQTIGLRETHGNLVPFINYTDRKGNYKCSPLARWIANLKKGNKLRARRVDPVDNVFDMRSIVVTTPSELCRQSGSGRPRKSSFRGVTYRKYSEKGAIRYLANIEVNQGKIHLGTFDTEEDAIQARKDAELKYWGYILGESK